MLCSFRLCSCHGVQALADSVSCLRFVITRHRLPPEATCLHCAAATVTRLLSDRCRITVLASKIQHCSHDLLDTLVANRYLRLPGAAGQSATTKEPNQHGMPTSAMFAERSAAGARRQASGRCQLTSGRPSAGAAHRSAGAHCQAVAASGANQLALSVQGLAQGGRCRRARRGGPYSVYSSLM